MNAFFNGNGISLGKEGVVDTLDDKEELNKVEDEEEEKVGFLSRAEAGGF